MKSIKPFNIKTVFSFIAALVLSSFIYIVVRHGHLFPVPFSSSSHIPDTTSLIALYTNIIFVWFVFFFFYICGSLFEIFKNSGKYQEQNPAPNNNPPTK